MCADLMMYEDSKVFACGLQLMFSNCCQTATLLENLQKVELLTAAQKELFTAIKNDVLAVGRLMYSFENWAVDDHFSTVDYEKYAHLQRLCSKIRNLCSAGDSATTPFEVQEMLHETEFFSHFTYLIGLDLSDFIPSCRGLLAKVIALVCNTTSQFVMGNSKNQTLVFGVLPSIIRFIDVMPEAVHLTASIFGENFELCQQVSEDLIAKVGNLIVRERSQGKFLPWYLMFFEAILVVGTRPVTKNQTIIIELIQQVAPHLVVHLPMGETGRRRLAALAARFECVAQLRCPDAARWAPGEDAELIYYLHSLALLMGLS